MIAEVLRIYQGSDGDATKALYARLETLGPIGIIALNLFRACKNSERAKVYRGRGYRGAAYDRKQWAMDNLCRVLVECGADLNWGWGIDELLRDRGDPHHHVLYIEIPTGQVSFHTGHRGAGPDYPGAWDGMRGTSADRICRWCARLLKAAQAAA